MLAGRGPVSAVVFLSKVKEEAGDDGVIRYEPMVEVGETKEESHFFGLGWGWPSSNAVKLHQVHDELAWFHNHHKIFYFRDVKLTFFKL